MSSFSSLSMNEFTEKAHDFIQSPLSMGIAIVCTIVSLLVSITSIYGHLSNYTIPRIQIYIIRILMICPVYALCSIFSLAFPHATIGIESISGCMESFVIYSFMSLILEYAGGESMCINRLAGESPLYHPWPFNYIFSPMDKNTNLIRICKQGTIQFVVIKPIMACLTLILLANGKYYDSGYRIFELIVYNLSYSIALYCLVLWYFATKKILKSYNPLLKFMTVKSIVFATYWQSLVIAIIFHTDALEQELYNSFVLCVEMVMFSILLYFAFHHIEYVQGLPENNVLSNIKDVFSVKDVAMDAYHNFNPKYQAYLSAKSIHNPKKNNKREMESDDFYGDVDLYDNEDLTDEESFDKHDDDEDNTAEEILIDLEHGVQQHHLQSNEKIISSSKRSQTKKGDKNSNKISNVNTDNNKTNGNKKNTIARILSGLMGREGDEASNTKQTEKNDHNFSDIPLNDTISSSVELQMQPPSSPPLTMQSEIVHNDGPYDGAYDFSTTKINESGNK